MVKSLYTVQTVNTIQKEKKMKLNVKLLDLYGEPITEGDDEEINILELCITALTQANIPADKGSTANMGRRYRIASRLAATKDNKKDVPDDIFTNKDKLTLMTCLSTLYNPMVVGRVAEIIDPALLKDD